jgi:hypothetical protein
MHNTWCEIWHYTLHSSKIEPIALLFSVEIYDRAIPLWCHTNCAPLLADLFLYSFEAEFIQKLLHEKKKILAVAFSSTFRCIDDVLFINNDQFHTYVDSIYSNELEIKDTTECCTSASYLDILLKLDNNSKLQLYDKRDDFNFPIVNFTFLCSNIPISPAYGVYISQLIHCARACSTYDHFVIPGIMLTNKFMSLGFLLFTSSFPQILRSLQRSSLPIQPPYRPNVVSCVSYQSLSGS